MDNKHVRQIHQSAAASCPFARGALSLSDFKNDDACTNNTHSSPIAMLY